MIVKLCRKCKTIIEYPNTYCSKCKELFEEKQKENRAMSNRKYNQSRNKEHVRFYKSTEWNLLKNKKLQDTLYKCERCEAIATEVHHIVELSEDWEKRLDYDNLKSVCLECHNYYHNRFQKKRRK